MKKLILTALLGITLTAQAAPGTDAPRTPDFDRLAQRLELDANQTEAFKTIMKARHEQRQNTLKRILAEKKQQDEETRQQLAGVLTEDQLKALGEMERRHFHRKGFKPRHDQNCDQDRKPGQKWKQGEEREHRLDRKHRLERHPEREQRQS